MKTYCKQIQTYVSFGVWRYIHGNVIAISDKLQSYRSADVQEEGFISVTLQTYIFFPAN